jgi:hypothetical protein
VPVRLLSLYLVPRRSLGYAGGSSIGAVREPRRRSTVNEPRGRSHVQEPYTERGCTLPYELLAVTTSPCRGY